MSKNNNLTAIITGASGDIGRSAANLMAERGYACVLVGNENFSEAEDAARLIEASGGTAVAVKCDLAAQDCAKVLRDQIDSRALPEVGILFSNAGKIHRPSNWTEQPPELVSESINVNFRSHVLLTQEFAPQMQRGGWGRIIYTSSTYGETGAAAVLAYSASKFALLSLCRSMARELGASGVTVNCISPGNIDTKMTAGAGDDVLDWVTSTTPIGRLGRVSEVVDVVEMLLGNDFLTGANIVVDGGHILNM